MTALTELEKSQSPITPVKAAAPQVVGSFPPLNESAATVLTQDDEEPYLEQIDVGETTHRKQWKPRIQFINKVMNNARLPVSQIQSVESVMVNSRLPVPIQSCKKYFKKWLNILCFLVLQILSSTVWSETHGRGNVRFESRYVAHPSRRRVRSQGYHDECFPRNNRKHGHIVLYFLTSAFSLSSIAQVMTVVDNLLAFRKAGPGDCICVRVFGGV